MEPKDEIKERLDVADVVAGYLTLKPAGSGSFKALCPFHGERSPSFYVSKEKQIWHCFGCSKGGDIFSFVMEMEGMSFPEALRMLGEKAGVEIPDYKNRPKEDKKHDVYKQMHELATKFYETLLWQHDQGASARAYLTERQFQKPIADIFRLGAAPEKWDALVTFLRSKKFSDQQIVESGLGKKRKDGTGVIDKFRQRLMIPLANTRGEVVGFTARLLIPQSEKTGPKYLNSPETPIYHKSDVLYGLHLAKKGIREEGAVIIVEGNLDVIASHKAEVTHVVASSGTALTESQLSQLKRVTDRLLFCFDDDEAGYNAAQRGIHLAQSMAFKIGVIAIPKQLGKDPDDVIKKSADEWRKLAKNPVHIMEYFFEKSLSKFDPSNIDSKKELAHFLLQEIARIPDAIEREHWLQKLSDTIHMDISILRSALTPSVQPKPETKQTPASKPIIKKKPTKIEAAIEFLMGLALQDEELRTELFANLAEELLPEGEWREVYKKSRAFYTDHQTDVSVQKHFFSELRNALQKDGKDDLASIADRAVIRVEHLIATLSRNNVREEYKRHLQLILEASIHEQKQLLQAQIRLAEQSGDADRLKLLMEQYTKLL